jgi:endogenous inhibitor of DNA gyrase (YacG/DUF329 family)
MVTVVKCPTCGKPVEWKPESRFRPFCSERCKQIDLGAWAEGKYTIASNDEDPASDLSEDSPSNHDLN